MADHLIGLTVHMEDIPAVYGIKITDILDQ